jgi:hypothetical protein
VKLIRPCLFAALFAAGTLAAPVVRAAGVCPDEPERCVERGVTLTHTAGVVNGASQSHAVSAPAVTAAAHKPAAATVRRSASKPARVAPLPSSSTPATPGMGMLLKLSGGTGGDVSWFPNRPADNTGATWVL